VQTEADFEPRDAEEERAADTRGFAEGEEVDEAIGVLLQEAAPLRHQPGVELAQCRLPTMSGTRTFWSSHCQMICAARGFSVARMSDVTRPRNFLPHTVT